MSIHLSVCVTPEDSHLRPRPSDSRKRGAKEATGGGWEASGTEGQGFVRVLGGHGLLPTPLNKAVALPSSPSALHSPRCHDPSDDDLTLDLDTRVEAHLHVPPHLAPLSQSDA